MNRLIRTVLSVFLSVMFLQVNCLAENEKQTSENGIITVETREELLVGFARLGIDEETSDRLADKISSGEMLDSMKPEYQNINPTVKRSDGLSYYAEYLYPDGSKKIVNITRGAYVYGGTDYNYGSYYQNVGATVTGDYGSVSLSFNTTYLSGSGIAQINSVYNPSNNSSLSGQNFGIDSQTVSSGNAIAHLSYTYSPSYISSGTLTLRLYVPTNKESAYASLFYQGN